MKLILVRHGETIENQLGILQGHSPGTLSENGINQVKKVALRLKNEKIDYIYSSDLTRTAETAREIANYHPNSPIYFVKEFREMDMGDFTGRKRDEVDWTNLDWKNLPPGLETRESMWMRVKKLLSDVYKKHPNSTVLFVGHNITNKALISVILNKPPDYMATLENHFNTAVSIFEIKENGNNIVHLMSCIKHLE